MRSKILTFSAILFFVLCGASQMLDAQTIASGPSIPNDGLVMRQIGALHGAQMTFASTSGAGNYGTLVQLGSVQFIDEALSTGYKYGYKFEVSLTPSTPTTPVGFRITATPRKYRVYGRISFYIDTAGAIRGGDKSGQVATADDPIIVSDLCSMGSIPDNERCTIQSLRTLHGAEMTYASTYGNGNYGSLPQLGEAFLISRPLATGSLHGYTFVVTYVSQIPGFPASFKINATPQTYGTTGVRSFFIDTSGVIRGADKHGASADENDPPVDQ